jgi:hypothetical protein
VSVVALCDSSKTRVAIRYELEDAECKGCPAVCLICGFWRAGVDDRVMRGTERYAQVMGLAAVGLELGFSSLGLGCCV